MKPRILASSSALVFLAVLIATGARSAAADDAAYMPPNEGKIAAALVARGKIPANATPQEKEAAVEAYLRARLSHGEPQGNPLARKRLDAVEDALNAAPGSAIRGRKLGNAPMAVAPSNPQWKTTAPQVDKLLLILVEFSRTPFTWATAAGTTRTEAGPLHNEIPTPNNSFDLWIPDFTPKHYQDMLFTPGGWTFPANAPRYAGERRGSMYDYYVVQSYGRYAVTGDAYGWFTVGKPEAYYGDNDENGNDLAPGDTRTLIADAVAVANAQNAIDWSQYDTDHDCIIDHPLFIHAGVDESGGGGAQQEDAIWAHSSATWARTGDAPYACPNGLDGIYIYNYTIMPEDGGVGVFAHEFGHDLGLPDEYDTIYSGRGDSVAFWSIMSAGSWQGRPAQTQPSDMSIWARNALGWLGGNLATTSMAKLTTDPVGVRLEQSERWGGPGTINALRINLPNKRVDVNVPHSGAYEWFGGRADLIDTALARTVDLGGKASASLSFWTWYDLEPYWDFGFVQVSTDGGATWTSLPIAGTTTSHDPSAMDAIVANLPGFTGKSGGWVQKTANLSAWAGQQVLLQFRYMTDWGTTGAGFYVDDVAVVADGATVFADDVETLDPAWAADGWTRDPGYSLKAHYYMAEWRNSRNMDTPFGGTSIVNFDEGLRNVYQYDKYGSTGNPDEPWWYAYNPGLVLWYRDTSYSDNWTGEPQNGGHPGHGFLLVVDAHDQAWMRPPTPGLGALPFNSNVQSCDAAFSLDKTFEQTLGAWGLTKTYPSLNAVPGFDDSLTYWSNVAPAASTLTPRYGLVFKVLGQASDGSAAVIGVGTK
jgi:immune inhibitor A